MGQNKNFKSSVKNFYKKNHNKSFKKERPISPFYSVIDNDLARDNIENDLTSADFQDLDKQIRE